MEIVIEDIAIELTCHQVDAACALVGMSTIPALLAGAALSRNGPGLAMLWIEPDSSIGFQRIE